jgi:hypothetical protein
MLWEGDWLAEDPAGDWDSFGEDLGTTVLDTVAPWALLKDAPDLPVIFAVSDASRKALQRCDDTETVDWLAMRDPDGSLKARLETLGATDDGCIDVGEESDVLADAMVDQGIPATVISLSDPSTTHTHLAPADLTLMADHIMAMSHD